MAHSLDRPIWNALLTRHAGLAEGGTMAKRYHPSVSMFAAAGDDSEESARELGRLAAPGENMLIVQADDIVVPPGFATVTTATLVQMTAEKFLPEIEDPRIARLGWSDAADMFELASLTKPGPFTLKALSFGDFWGIRVDGRLIAMAGERLKHPGLTELSGVCTHPDFRGKGLGRLMSLYVGGRIFAKGEKPFLHAYATNSTAITLYESIGFVLRSHMHAAIVTPETDHLESDATPHVFAKI